MRRPMLFSLALALALRDNRFDLVGSDINAD